MAFKDWRINYLCIAGAAIGIVSFFAPWYSFSPNPDISGPYGSFIRIMNPAHSTSLLGFAAQTFDWITPIIDPFRGFLDLGVYLLISGTLITLVTPVGGLIQLSGFALFLSTVIYRIGPEIDFIGIPIGTRYLDWGFYLGIFSAIVIFVSIYKPVGRGYAKVFHLGDRLLTMNPLPHIFAEYRPRFKSGVALLGTIIGFVSIFLPWVSSIPGVGGLNVINMITIRGVDLAFALAGALFIIGTILSIITSLGFCVQLSGLALLFITTIGSSIGLGALVGIASSSIILLSLFLPNFRFSNREQFSLRKRLLNITAGLKMRCPECGTFIQHIRDSCPNCGTSNTEGKPAES